MPDCRDKSDESNTLCKNYKERCNFQTGLCNWHQDKSEDSDWSVGNGQNSTDSNAPVIDHTTGTFKSYFP